MQNYVIVTDSACDLPKNIIEKFDIKVIPYDLTFDGENYLNSLDLDPKEFYKKIRNGKTSKTTQINSFKFIEFFEPFLKNNLDIIFIGLSGGLTGTYSPLGTAIDELRKSYPFNKIIVVDSLSATLGLGMLVYNACIKKDKGYSIDNLEVWLNENKSRLYHVATVNDLLHLRRGGRIPATTAVVGTMLNIKPMIKMNSSGTLESFAKVRGRKSAILSLFDYIKNNMTEIENDTIFIAHGDCIDDANFLSQEVKNKLNIKNVIINYIGPIVGSHIGPEALAVFFWSNKR